jgi:hypothetical protein
MRVEITSWRHWGNTTYLAELSSCLHIFLHGVEDRGVLLEHCAVWPPAAAVYGRVGGIMAVAQIESQAVHDDSVRGGVGSGHLRQNPPRKVVA